MNRNTIRKYFFTGLAVVLPIVLSAWVLVKAFFLLTDFLVSLLQLYHPTDRTALIVIARFASLLIIFIALVLIGALTRNVIGRRLVGLVETICERLPVFGKLYSACRQIIKAFTDSRKTVFRRVVLVPYPREGLYTIAFLTSETSGEAREKTRKELVNVFIPTSPNPTSGMLIMVPREDIVPLDMSVEDGMKLVISGGALVPGVPPAPEI